jgi:hypothetical protein
VWNPVTSILLKTDWQYTEPVEGGFFRLKHSSQPRKGILQIAQAEFNIDNSVNLTEAITLQSGSELEILTCATPAYFSSRRLAIRRISTQPSLENQLRDLLIPAILRNDNSDFLGASQSKWTIQIEVSDVPLTNPVSSNQPSTNCTITNVNAAIASTQILSANTSRKGAILQNNSASNLYLEFTAAATNASVPKLVPGAYYEIPYNFTGLINGIWDTASTTTGVIVKEFA